mmetsp:Transcript_100630/g.199951  ORF Transcript_100630/g.199951 Transcript_100630/m.199951 type:complete len:254 (+) Transcript_100630:132-893(+)
MPTFHSQGFFAGSFLSPRKLPFGDPKSRRKIWPCQFRSNNACERDALGEARPMQGSGPDTGGCCLRPRRAQERLPNNSRLVLLLSLFAQRSISTCVTMSSGFGITHHSGKSHGGTLPPTGGSVTASTAFEASAVLPVAVPLLGLAGGSAAACLSASACFAISCAFRAASCCSCTFLASNSNPFSRSLNCILSLSTNSRSLLLNQPVKIATSFSISSRFGPDFSCASWSCRSASISLRFSASTSNGGPCASLSA